MTFQHHTEIPHRVFFNDMSENYMFDEFKNCDVIYSEIAENNSSEYLKNINKLVTELGKPAFIVCGKSAKKYFPDASVKGIKTNISDCQLYTWNCKYNVPFDNTNDLLNFLSSVYDKCLDFSCGYGRHLFKFKDFIACDIDKDCLTYISLLLRKKEQKLDGKTNGKT